MKIHVILYLIVIVFLSYPQEIHSKSIVVLPGGEIKVRVFDVSTGDPISDVVATIDDSISFIPHTIKWVGRIVDVGRHSLQFSHQDYYSEIIKSVLVANDTILNISVWLKPKSIKIETSPKFSIFNISKSQMRRSILTGHIIDTESKLPIEGAEIRFELLDTLLTAASDSQGNYECQINRIMPGIRIFNCTHPDYYKLTIESKTSVFSYKTDSDVSLVKKQKSLEHLKRRNLKAILLTISSESKGGGGSVKNTSESIVGVGEEFLIKNSQDNSVESLLLSSSFILLKIVNPHEIIVQYDNSALRCYPKDVEHVAPNQVIIRNDAIGFGTKTTCSGTIYSIRIAGHP